MSSIQTLVRKLRKDSTPSERLLWKYLRNRNFLGLRFKRQYPIAYQTGKLGENHYFITDFYCFDKKLIVELDGEIHNEQQEYDRTRDEILTELGNRILRIRNEELSDIQMVLKKIENACT